MPCVGLIICWKTGPFSPFAPVFEPNVQKHFSQYIIVWQHKLIHYVPLGCILSKEMQREREKKKNRIKKKKKKEAITERWLAGAERCKEKADWGILWEFLFPGRCG